MPCGEEEGKGLWKLDGDEWEGAGMNGAGNFVKTLIARDFILRLNALNNVWRRVNPDPLGSMGASPERLRAIHIGLHKKRQF